MPSVSRDCETPGASRLARPKLPLVSSRNGPSVKVRDSCPQTPQGENHKIADAQLPPSCVFADSHCLLGGATQMDCGMELLVLRTYQRASLHGQHRGACPVRNFLFNPHTAFQYKQQIATQRAVLRRGIFANASSVLVREANKQ